MQTALQCLKWYFQDRAKVHCQGGRKLGFKLLQGNQEMGSLPLGQLLKEKLLGKGDGGGEGHKSISVHVFFTLWLSVASLALEL